MNKRIGLSAAVAAMLAAMSNGLLSVGGASNGPEFIAFESGPVRPLAITPDRRRLLATNTPNGTLEIFDITSGTPVFESRVAVGLEPVAVAARTDDEVWVVNHLSDSVSVVSLAGTPRVVRTLLVGDEPRDIVFAGDPLRAFITTAHRGQQRVAAELASVPGAGDPQFTTPGVPRADVWVFDPVSQENASPGGIPLRILSFFTDTPRALAVSADKKTVYVAGFKTGNQTTTVSDGRVCEGFKADQPCTMRDRSVSPGGNPGPATNAKGEPAPETGLIVKFNPSTGHWEDTLRRNWDNSVKFNLPDTDVFAVDAGSLMQREAFAHVGTTLFNMAVNPVSGALYVSNTEAFNHVRFEGPGKFAGSTVQGHLAETRLTVIRESAVMPRHLNQHIDYAKLAGSPGFDLSARDHSLSTPLDLAVSADGSRIYVAAYGSSAVGVLDAQAVEQDNFDPTTASAGYIRVSGGGPGGLALDEDRGVLYVLTRFDNAVKTVRLESREETTAVAMPNPEPPSVKEGRRLLYDATRYSGNGEASCASCHQFGDMDDLAWDLGNPDGEVTKSPIPINFGPFLNPIFQQLLGIDIKLNGSGKAEDFHPMKGPFTTQTLRGMRFSGAMHWRGDRSTGPAGTSAYDANISFLNFAGAFPDLIGSPDQPSKAEMQAFADFQLQVLPPPNPVRNLDNSLTASQQRGAAFYSGTRASDGVVSPLLDTLVGKASFTCNECHELDPAKGFFGTGGKQSFEGLPQIVKIPHLRNVYARVGMFGTPQLSFFYDAPGSAHLGDQVRGFGFTGDGSTDTMFRFFTATVFRPTSNSGFPQNDPDGARRDMEQFMFAFDSDLAPVVGQQVTLTKENAVAAGRRVDLLLSRSGAPFVSKSLNGSEPVRECDLVVYAVQDGRVKAFLYDPEAKNFIPDDDGERLAESRIRALAVEAGQPVTYLAATPGSGPRLLARSR